MRTKAVGFYWTLPVPWAGFRDVPNEIAEAAKSSRTIAYQQARIHRYAREEGYDLFHEAVFVEVAPDRASHSIAGPLDKVAPICRLNDATLLVVDFAVLQGWRSHEPMQQYAAKIGLAVEMIYPDLDVVDGQLFDPHEHFSSWRQRQAEWSAGKEKRAAEARKRALALRAEGLSNSEIADRLAEEGVATRTGRPWNAENLRKLLSA